MTLPLAADLQAAVVAAAQEQSTLTRQQLILLLTALWQSLPDYRNRSMLEFAREAVSVIEGAMRHTQASTSAYLATIFGATPVATPTVSIATVRHGADPLEVYSRPFHLIWRQLAANAPLDAQKIGAAIDAGFARVEQLASTDLQLAKTHTVRDQLRDHRTVVGYRRQLEGAHSCALCIVASTRRYNKEDLMPIHPACDCLPVPILAGEKADLNLDPALLEAAHSTVADAFGADSTAARYIRGAFKQNGDAVLYRDVLITHHHGELGPVLGVRGQKFTGPGDIAA